MGFLIPGSLVRVQPGVLLCRTDWCAGESTVLEYPAVADCLAGLPRTGPPGFPHRPEAADVTVEQQAVGTDTRHSAAVAIPRPNHPSESGEARSSFFSDVSIVPSTPRSSRMSIEPLIAMSPVIPIVPCMKTFMGLWRQPLMVSNAARIQVRAIDRRVARAQTDGAVVRQNHRFSRSQVSGSPRPAWCLRSGLRKPRSWPRFRRVSR